MANINNEVKTKFTVEGTNEVKNETKSLSKNLTNVEQKLKSMKSASQLSGKAIKGLANNTKDANSKLTLPNLSVAIQGILKIKDSILGASKLSYDYIENLNLLDSAFGDNYLKARKFANSLAEVYGLDESEIIQYLGNFRQFGAALGFASDNADMLAENLTLMAGDISSLYNITLSQASEKLTSALTGQTKAIRSLGADITQASLQQQLYNMGINESISNMNRAEKTILIYLSLEKQLANSQGDLAKTLMSPSNQMKVMAAQVQRLGRALGNSLLPILQTILPWLNGFLMALIEIANFISILLGYDPVDFEFGGALSNDIGGLDDSIGSVSDGLDGVGSSASGANKELDDMAKKLTGLRSFDKLNVIETPKDTSSGAGGGGGGGSAGGGIAGGGINSKLLDA